MWDPTQDLPNWNLHFNHISKWFMCMLKSAKQYFILSWPLLHYITGITERGKSSTHHFQSHSLDHSLYMLWINSNENVVNSPALTVTSLPLDLMSDSILQAWHWSTILMPFLRLFVLEPWKTYLYWAVSLLRSTIKRQQKIFLLLYSLGEFLLILHEYFKYHCGKAWPDPFQTELGHLFCNSKAL
jgi:hypothetical protein